MGQPHQGPIWDVAILGAGAAGLMAAIRAAERGRTALLLEKNRRPGVKILMSGGTRCNLTNARGLKNPRVVSGPIDPAFDPRAARGSRSIQQAFGPLAGPFLGPALKAFGVEAAIALFEAEGVVTKVEANGKVFPLSDRAVDVLDALMRRLRRSGALLRVDCPVRDIEFTGNHFDIRTTTGETFTARRVVVTTGGQSYPGCGTTGDGYAIARKFGHTIIEPRPALVPIRVDLEWVRRLQGLTIPDANASVVDAEGAVLLERREAILFAHFGLTGPAILDVSRAVARHRQSEALQLRIDWLPDVRPEALDGRIQVMSRQGRPLVASLLPASLPRRLAEALVTAAGIPLERQGPELTRDERRRLVESVKGLRLPIAGTLGFARAEVTSGGVALDEVDPVTLESRFRPGLLFAGEVLDLDGLIGGYNFQAAWSTGWLAGDQA